MAVPAQPTLYLVDGHALAYRTYFALTSSGFSGTTRSGEPTAGVYGFTSVLLRLLEQERPDFIAVSFDLGKTFRDELFPAYKGTRDKMPDDLRTQLERIREVVQAFDIPIFEMEGYEADDVLGTLSRLAAARGVRVVIVTGDRDLLQLVTEQVSVSLPGKSLAEGQLYGPAEVAHRFGVTPAQLVDYKALVGDASDNIPGVAGIGEKSAAQLLQQFLSLDEIYARLDEVPPRHRGKLEAGRESALLSRRLAAIVTDLALPFDLKLCAAPRLDAAEPGFDRARVAAVFRELDFRTLIKRVAGAGGSATAAPGAADQLDLFGGQPVLEAGSPPAALTEVTIVQTSAALEALAAALAAAAVIAFDVETTSTDQMRAELVGVSLAVAAGQGYYIPVGHAPECAPGGQLPWAQVRAALAPALGNAAIRKAGHNAKYDYVVLARHGLTVQPVAFDTMLAEWMLDPASRNLGLKNLAWARLGVTMTEIQALLGKGKLQRTMDAVPVAEAAPYAAADADITLRLMQVLAAELAQRAAPAIVALELALLPVLAGMELAGVQLDSPYLAGMSLELEKQIAVLQKDLFLAVGYEFNLNSTQQLAKALYDDLGLTPPRRTKRTAAGQFSTAADVLEELAPDNAVVRQLLEYRELAKLKSTYVDALPLTVNPGTGRVHTSYLQCGTVTGRIASADPNLQNIPTRTQTGRQVRRGFVAAAGRQLVALDYSQVELRIAAHFSGDEFLLDAFARDVDIHTATAAAVRNLALQDVSSEQRRQAKAVNFGLLYGMGSFSLARQTGMTLGESEDFIKAYFARLPRLKQYLEDTKLQAQTQGYVATVLGRRRYFPQLQRAPSGQAEVIARQRAEREAINAPIQGTAADVIKLAMVALARALPQQLPAAQLLLQVHDELLFECADGQVAPLVALARPLMENALALTVKLRVDARAGKNWEEMQRVSG